MGETCSYLAILRIFEVPKGQHANGRHPRQLRSRTHIRTSHPGRGHHPKRERTARGNSMAMILFLPRTLELG